MTASEKIKNQILKTDAKNKKDRDKLVEQYKKAKDKETAAAKAKKGAKK